LITKRTSNIKRRNRPNGRKNNFQRNGYDSYSNKPKGSVSKVLERYLNLAQDAQSNGDRIKAEGFYQHAEHYQRIMNSNVNKTPEKKIDIEDKESNSHEQRVENDINDSNKVLSRTERAENAKYRRSNKFEGDQSLGQDEKQPTPKDNSFTTDGVEALKAFSSSVDKTE